MSNIELDCDQMVRHDFLDSTTKTSMYVCMLFSCSWSHGVEQTNLATESLILSLRSSYNNLAHVNRCYIVDADVFNWDNGNRLMF